MFDQSGWSGTTITSENAVSDEGDFSICTTCRPETPVYHLSLDKPIRGWYTRQHCVQIQLNARSSIIYSDTHQLFISVIDVMVASQTWLFLVNWYVLSRMENNRRKENSKPMTVEMMIYVDIKRVIQRTSAMDVVIG